MWFWNWLKRIFTPSLLTPMELYYLEGATNVSELEARMRYIERGAFRKRFVPYY